MFEEIINCIWKSNNIRISFHVSPDGDSMGSSLALMQGLRRMGKYARVISNETIPKLYEYLPYASEIKSEIIDKDVDCVIILDCGNKERINCDLNSSDNKKYVLINLDHHISNDKYGDINFVGTQYSSMGEIVYLLLKEMNIQIDKYIALCLYTSIITDCGSFKYSNTTPLTHQICAELIATGIDFPEIHRIIYENKDYKIVKLSGKLIETMHLECDGKICILQLTNRMLDEMECDSLDVSDLISIGTEIAGVEVVIFIKEKKGNLKVSLRSKKQFDVRKIAECYGGGGHMKAAGFTYEGDINFIRDELTKMVSKELQLCKV